MEGSHPAPQVPARASAGPVRARLSRDSTRRTTLLSLGRPRSVCVAGWRKHRRSGRPPVFVPLDAVTNRRCRRRRSVRATDRPGASRAEQGSKRRSLQVHLHATATLPVRCGLRASQSADALVATPNLRSNSGGRGGNNFLLQRGPATERGRTRQWRVVWVSVGVEKAQSAVFRRSKKGSGGPDVTGTGPFRIDVNKLDLEWSSESRHSLLCLSSPGPASH